MIAEYKTDGFYDELIERSGTPRLGMEPLFSKLAEIGGEGVIHRQRDAEELMFRLGITFNVYGDERREERIFPFDLIPRIIGAKEWEWIDKGLKQRIEALNLFIDDIYHDQKILKDKAVPDFVVKSSKCFREQCVGLKPPQGIWCHITGTDLVRDRDGQIYVLEDNLRCPSGVSYVLENRDVMKHAFPELFEMWAIRPVDDYPNHLLQTLQHLAPYGSDQPKVCLLSPGIYNSAYFEHSFLAQQMGIELVEGSDLVVANNQVMMRTIRGFERVDVIYRRIDDDFIDPEAFRADSMLGVPGLMEVYKAGRVALANAPGTGIADDKVIYAYVPKMIKYYLDQEAIIPNVPTYVCWDEKDQKHVLENLENFVVKAANESGGYGMLVGPHASASEIAGFREKIVSDARNYIAQPTLGLSRVPVIVDHSFEGRHVDLRPYILYGRSIYVMPGGLTRVALKKGSLVVNSSQGGGSKDTWVLVGDGRNGTTTDGAPC